MAESELMGVVTSNCAPVSKGTGETVAGGRAAGELARLVLPLFHRGFTL